MEPYEYLVVDVPSQGVGPVMSLVLERQAQCQKMESGTELTHLEFIIPARGLIGLRTRMMTATNGLAIIHHSFHDYLPVKPVLAGRANGVMISTETGKATGFALENLDAVGRWRDEDAGMPIDSTGQLADGTPLSGAADLRSAVLARSDAFMTVATEKLLIYALGRPMHATDMSTVRQIVRTAARNDHKFSSLVLGVVESAPFCYRVKG